MTLPYRYNDTFNVKNSNHITNFVIKIFLSLTVHLPVLPYCVYLSSDMNRGYAQLPVTSFSF